MNGLDEKMSINCKKRLTIFLYPSRDVTNQTLPGREYWAGKSLTFFYSVDVWGPDRYVSLVELELKGVWHEIFDLRFRSWISFPQALKYSNGVVLNFFENSRRYSWMNIFRRCRGVNDTGKKFMPPAICHGEINKKPKTVHRCQWHRR